MTSPDRRLEEVGLELSAIPPLLFTPKLVPVLEHGGLGYLSGIGPVGVAERRRRPGSGLGA